MVVAVGAVLLEIHEVKYLGTWTFFFSFLFFSLPLVGGRER